MHLNAHWHSPFTSSEKKSWSLLKNWNWFLRMMRAEWKANKWMNEKCECHLVGLQQRLFVICLMLVCMLQANEMTFPIDWIRNQSAWWNDTSWLINREMHLKMGIDLTETPPFAPKCHFTFSSLVHVVFRTHFASLVMLVFYEKTMQFEMIFHCIIFSLIFIFINTRSLFMLMIL